MLSGLKFIPREKLDKAEDESSYDSGEKRKKSRSKKDRSRRKKKSSGCSSSDDELERIKGSRKKNKWYDSNEDSLSGSDSGLEHGEKKRQSKKARRRKRGYSSEYSPSNSESDHSRRAKKHDRGEKQRQKKKKETLGEQDDVEDNSCDDAGGSQPRMYNNIVRKEMGLDWMLRPKDNLVKLPAAESANQPEEAPVEEVRKPNPRELNPYLKDNGSGYPDESDGSRAGGNQLLSSAVVGDGGASWRLKALKRAREQAAREGKKLDEVVEERWGSLGQLAVSVASHTAAPSHAHIHAIKNRKRGQMEEEQATDDKKYDKSSEKDLSNQNPRMRMPKFQESLSWRKQKRQHMTAEDSDLVSAAVSGLNKFSNDGSFINKFKGKKNDELSDKIDKSHANSGERESTMTNAIVKPSLTANQLAAKVLQLRMKGMHDEAEKLLKEAESMKVKNDADDGLSRPQIDGSTSRYIMHDVSARRKEKEDDADMHLAQKIVRDQRYSLSGRADDEYDYDDGPRRKTRKKGGSNDHKSAQLTHHAQRILTQEERCQHCFENPRRPKHLVVAIANFTYLSLPQWQPVVAGHCCILTMQHESATRTVDNNVWDEIRNFKKCLIMMFAKQGKEVVFLETVMGLAQQRRHCLIECIPLPQEVAKQAPVYFKKAIDEAEDEWSQHNAKKLIDTSEKGLRGSIPKNFPYFHVEFGLNRGYVHVIDDEKEFKSDFGLNVVRGMLRLPAEDMHRRRQQESIETQKQAVASFARDWEPFDWTKQLD